MSYLENDTVNTAVFLAYCAVSVIYPVFLFFLPLICYDIFSSRARYALLIAVIPAGVGFTTLPLLGCIFIIPFIALSYLIKLRTASVEKN